MPTHKRTEWTFEYGAAELAEAAAEKCKFHTERAEWWKGQRERVMKEVRETGIDISESVASEFGKYASNAANGPRIVIDATLQAKLVECHDKILEHEKKARDYDGWHQMLTANELKRLDLTQDDWLFFFGK